MKVDTLTDLPQSLDPNKQLCFFFHSISTTSLSLFLSLSFSPRWKYRREALEGRASLRLAIKGSGVTLDLSQTEVSSNCSLPASPFEISQFSAGLCFFSSFGPSHSTKCRKTWGTKVRQKDVDMSCSWWERKGLVIRVFLVCRKFQFTFVSDISWEIKSLFRSTKHVCFQRRVCDDLCGSMGTFFLYWSIIVVSGW